MKKITLFLEFIVTGVIGFTTGWLIILLLFGKIAKEDNQLIKKLSEYYHIFNKWLILKQQQKSIAEYFRAKDYKSVGIYGMKEIGERLLYELEESGITVKCIIDQDNSLIQHHISVISPNDKIPDVDVVVVTASYYFDEIKERLNGKVSGDIISIEDVIYGIS